MSGSGPLALAPELEAFRRQFEQLSAQADALAAALDDARFYREPAPDAWSVAQCIDHLNVTARLYLPMLDEGIAEAIRRGRYGSGPFRYSPLGRLVVALNEPPARIRFKAPAGFRPEPHRSRQEIMAAFRAYQVQYVDRLRQANGVDLARARVRFPGVSWLWIPLGSAFALMAAHERRHLWQAGRIAAGGQSGKNPAGRGVRPPGRYSCCVVRSNSPTATAACDRRGSAPPSRCRAAVSTDTPDA